MQNEKMKTRNTEIFETMVGHSDKKEEEEDQLN
jgi:hypothetical protein